MTSDQRVAAPAPGQLVTVRNRQWVAADVVRGEVASSDPNVLTGRAPHLVTLASIEDDARDEELSVVWELEPGAVVHDVAVLPSPEHGFDEPPRTTATWSRSPRCWSCWTTSASLAVSGQPRISWPGSWCAGSRARCRRSGTARPGSPGATSTTWKSATPSRSAARTSC